MDLSIPPWTLWAAAAVLAVLAGFVVAVTIRRGRSLQTAVPDLTFWSPSGQPAPGAGGRAARPVAFMPAPAPLAPSPVEDPAEHRVSYRRVGNPVLVLLTDGRDGQQPIQAWVVDRSRHGLRLVAQRAVAVGQRYHVRPVNAPPAAPWTAMEVRHCGAQDDYWDIGGRFLEPPSMQVLLLFG